MPTMTSTLHANQFLEHAPFSTSAYSTSRDDRLHGAEQYVLTSSFGNNIWQTQGQASCRLSIEPSRQGFSRQPALSLALPNIRAQPQPIPSSGGKQSPGLCDRDDTRNIDPPSAQSRSQNNSAILTPTSLTSPSETSQTGTTRHDSTTTHSSGIVSCGPGDGLYSWPTAKEFQPSSQKYTLDASRTAASHGKHKPAIFLGPGNNGRGPQSIQAIWASNTDHLQPLTTSHIRQNSLLQSGTGNTTENNQDRSNINFRTFRQEGQMNGLIENMKNLSMNQTNFDSEDWQTTPTWQAKSDMIRPRANGEQQNRCPNPQKHWTQTPYLAKASDRLGDAAYKRSAQIGGAPSTYTITGPTDKFHQYQSTSIPVPYETNPNDRFSAQSRHEQYSLPNQYATSTGLQCFNESYAMHNNFPTDFRININPYETIQGVQQYLLSETPVKGSHESHHISRSPLLEEFRLNGKTRKYELHEIFGHIVEFSGDQLGSRFIQHKLEIASSEEKEVVFKEISCDSRQLMTDVFGNYVIQKMFDNGNQTQKKLLANHMRGHVYALSTQTYGCRVVQKALEHILTDQQASLIRELEGNVLKVVENQNGNHVIQKAIECVPGEHIQFIVDAHRNHVHYLSKHPYGCRVIQRMLEHCQPRAKRQILDELHLDIADLIQDAFGNYVVQHVIVNGEAQDRKPVIDKVQSRLMENATHKFASNVVEKALDYADKEQRNSMVRRLTARDEHGQSQVIKMLSHQYGNYVIQRCAAHLSGHALYSLIQEMEQYLAQLRRVSTGKQVTALEGSIREAQMRLQSQRFDNSISHIPTQPRTTLLRR